MQQHAGSPALFFRIREALLASALVAGLTAVASAQSVNVTLNGAPLWLNPPPITRDGRVFVPLRGVFEHLGASVVYSDGTINAQGNGHSVQLHIGSTQAAVDGNGQQLDVAPFLVGSSTYVPLRFVSQALGATVDYDAGNRIVALNGGNGGNGGNGSQQSDTRAPRNAPPRRSDVALRAQRPGNNARTAERRPSIEAQFDRAQVDPNSVRVVLDGLDVTGSASRSESGVVFSPPSDLRSGQHTVRLTGRDVDARPFDLSWQFTTAAAPQAQSGLTLRDMRPESNANVDTRRPTIEAQFGQTQANPGSIRVSLDGRDITGDTSRSANGIAFSPGSDLRSGKHTVQVTGRDVNDRPFDRSWQFTTGDAVVSNFIDRLQPADDARVGAGFNVTGRTQPNSRVVVQVGATGDQQQRSVNDALGQLLGIGQHPNAARVETTADGSGNFSVQMDMGANSGQTLALVVTSTEPRTQATAREQRSLVVR